jgi:hypothetical protein
MFEFEATCVMTINSFSVLNKPDQQNWDCGRTFGAK